ncbi:MAG: hypothetical protein Q7R35_11215 [Elusimicrobiota bacterium]|nr:hypothetical protein [Elusimicrobiota bacterium]
MTTLTQCPDCGKEVSAATSLCTGCGRLVQLQAEAPVQAAIPGSAGSSRWSSLKNLLVICAGVALFSLGVLALYHYLPRRDAPPAQAEKPAAQEAGDRADRGIVPEGLPAATDFIPLKRGLAEIEKLYGKSMELVSSAPIGPGPLEGGTLKTYRTETATDEIAFREDRVYKRILAFNISEIEGEVASFCSSVYLLALYPTAYDIKYSRDAVPAGVRANSGTFGAKCAALRSSGGVAAEQYEIDGDYVFGCINQDNTRLEFVITSEGLFKTERLSRSAR